ncbi:cyclic nucleotide-binding domain-containing protein [Streptomyces sp. NBC_01264]|uniref:cyclic nucleotide-binding domain-containing protein n=1 Tax=Streptomyces sp. NBC_01264 TaxID=2903804 RepID=UPI00225823E9|nr:cyclic nucleotide-binding domain-containing protein [Streptomyces sp. NBC_01264]MCX4781593.1 cyclic nucleotide-binding domain-containing protein [Streptomyces sp. NBC_01264]
MSTPSPIRMSAALSAEHRARLMSMAQEVNFAEGKRIFNEGGRADRFWIVRTGTVTLDVHVPGRQPAVIENLGPGELVGWSWLFRPYTWHFGAEAMTPVRTHEFEAAAVRMMMDADPAFGSAIGHWVGQVLAHRLLAARIRLLDLYAPHGSGGTL